MDANGEKEKKTGPRACGTCAKAKARCIPCSNPLKCERCDRLNKPCSKQVAAPPRPKKEQKPAKVAELEKRIADLSSKLHASEVSSPGKTAPRWQERTARWPYSHILPGVSDDSNRQKSTNDTVDAPSNPWPTILPGNPVVKRDSSSPKPFKGWPTGPEAIKMLSIFRAKLMPLFPFIILPADLSAEQLEWERPFLYKAIMLEACYKDSSRQLRLGRELLGQFTEAAFTRPRKSDDLLQGLLLYLAWFHYGLNSFQVTNLLFLARSICVGLGFNENRGDFKNVEHGAPSMDQMRAFAGTYYMTTNVFTTSKRPHALMNTTHIDAICQKIEKRAEYATDALLVKLVRIQMIAQAICTAVSKDQNDFQIQHPSILPFRMVAQSFHAQIDEFRATLPPHLQNHDNLQAHICIAEMLLYEVALHEDHHLARALQPTDRLEVLWTLLNIGKAFMELRFATSVRGTPRFLCVSTYDSMFAFFTCLKLFNLEVVGWNLTVVRQHLNLIGLIDGQIGDLELFCALRERKQDNASNSSSDDNSQDADPLWKLVAMLRAVRSVLIASTAAPAPVVPGAESVNFPAATWPMQASDNPNLGIAAVPTDLSMWQEFMTDALWNPGGDWPEPHNLQDQQDLTASLPNHYFSVEGMHIEDQ